MKEAADKLRGEMKDKRSHWDKFADAKNAADAEAAEEVERKKRAGADDAAKLDQDKKRKAVNDAKGDLKKLFDTKVKGKQHNWKEFEEALADAKKQYDAKKADPALKKAWEALDAIKKEYTTKSKFIETQEGAMKKFAGEEAARVKKLRETQIKQLTTKREQMDKTKKLVQAERAKLEQYQKQMDETSDKSDANMTKIMTEVNKYRTAMEEKERELQKEEKAWKFSMDQMKKEDKVRAEKRKGE